MQSREVERWSWGSTKGWRLVSVKDLENGQSHGVTEIIQQKRMVIEWQRAKNYLGQALSNLLHLH